MTKYYKALITRSGDSPVASNVNTNINPAPECIMSFIGEPLPVFAIPISGEENVSATPCNCAYVKAFRINLSYIYFKPYDSSGNQLYDNVSFYVNIEIR